MDLKSIVGIILLCLLAGQIQATEDDNQMRISWVKELKALMLELEKTPPYDLTKSNEKSFLEKFKLFEEAWADSPYNCFFAGWPSTLKIIGEKKYCLSPEKINSTYNTGNCKANELLCQPLLFGSNLCVYFSSNQDKQLAFSRCEEKFHKESKGNYDYLKSLSREQSDALIELSYLASDVCEKGSQKGTGMCKRLLQKLPGGLKSIQKGWQESFQTQMVQSVTQNFSAPVKVASETPQQTIIAPDELICMPVSPTGEVDTHSDLLKKVSDNEIEKLYETMKSNFEKSAFCKPENVVNNPSERPSGVILNSFLKSVDELLGSKHPLENKMSFLNDIVGQFKLSLKTRNEVGLLLGLLEKEKNKKAKDQSKIKVILLKDFIENSRNNPSGWQDKIKQGLFENHIFVKSQDGSIKCPFVSKDAFKKALIGRASIIAKGQKDFINRDTLTIVDYTRPSNERRLFVLDLSKQEVLHNTWVGHGLGNKNTVGKDGLGGSPDMSNKAGSRQSSDGFILATEPTIGKKWGPNVVLKGIDKNNSRIEEREIVLHGWMSVLDDYNVGVQDYNYKTGYYGKVKDPVKAIENLNLSTASQKDIDRALIQLTSSAIITPYLANTHGCLGVSIANTKHLDFRNRDKSQLETLREDLPGSLIFSYSGPEMKSKYFD